MNFDDAKVKSWITQLDAANAQTLRGPLERRGTIVILGWARLALQAAEGSGLNLSVSELCAELVTRGWRVIYLRSGMEYSLRPSMRIEMKEIWRGVGCFSLINSPNLAPGNYNFRNVTDQVDHASQAAMVCAFVAAAGAGVVHAHSLEGFPLSLVGALRAVTAAEPEYWGMAAWMDSAIFSRAGIPTVIYGPRGFGMHGAEEYVEVESVTRCAAVIAESAARWLRETVA